LVKRTVLDTQPISVKYELTEHGNTLQTIISNLTAWGVVHQNFNRLWSCSFVLFDYNEIRI